VEAVVMKALSKAPTDRYPSVNAFARAFEEAANSTATTAAPSSGSAPAVAGTDGKDKGGLFGKMKGLFGR
jgi:serine/threonine-protein kinase